MLDGGSTIFVAAIEDGISDIVVCSLLKDSEYMPDECSYQGAQEHRE